MILHAIDQRRQIVFADAQFVEMFLLQISIAGRRELLMIHLFKDWFWRNRLRGRDWRVFVMNDRAGVRARRGTQLGGLFRLVRLRDER